ncbi:PTB domain-containing engulfment adapter protein 1 [Amphibalanus amphitrite]|uniref:PTB domain-containing engulfment adapter protein 1 n=1 Tax=Amphibalanus amphitrite TaxID=1232801 RepID=A0A6A4X4J5_AMPAM|nr:PTB domain-containing engulfment adapter protein 1 [Amphibalanus amphitrite]
MRNSAILRWTQNNKLLQRSNSQGSNTKAPWVHPADAMKTGHIAYLVKFLGRTEVDQPKGIEVVKEGIRKLQFGQEIKKSECSKLPKRELTISINGVAIQDPKTKEILYQYPLHRISYCADDKGEKKFFSFIAKEADKEVHSCFVFVSDKLAEEITLTIGQAFDLAYRQFLDSSGRDLENRKQMMMLQKRLALAKAEADELRRRLRDVAELAPPAAVHNYCRQNLPTESKDLFGAEPFAPSAPISQPPPPPPPQQQQQQQQDQDQSSDDPFGMGSFQGSPGEIENAIGLLDRRLSEMKDGFSRGLSIGNDDFSLDDLDPLKN